MSKQLLLVCLALILLEVKSAPNFKIKEALQDDAGFEPGEADFEYARSLPVEADLRVERQSSDCYDWKPLECMQLDARACGTSAAVQRDCPRTCQMCDEYVV
ncbi:hypothetical protein OS493_010090 [Desmophyllum pertusum]|uniref:ShKT domain-containing protein n=1 Tax=Desmophyllum pertusum TaxID=174260 RepID=A0A9W9YEK3_9CNID|nr:hypothetical protein OS493_010090 [Desmophyllum pertusum]